MKETCRTSRVANRRFAHYLKTIRVWWTLRSYTGVGWSGRHPENVNLRMARVIESFLSSSLSFPGLYFCAIGVVSNSSHALSPFAFAADLSGFGIVPRFVQSGLFQSFLGHTNQTASRFQCGEG